MEAKYFFSEFEPITTPVVTNIEYDDISMGFVY